jgi:DNA-binding NarL/FixJ family response regulator
MRILVHLSNFLLCEALAALMLPSANGDQVTAAVDCSPLIDLQPDIIVVDPHTLQQQLFDRWPEAKFVLIDTGLSEEEIVRFLISFKLFGIITPDTDAVLFRKALEVIHGGQVWIDNGKLKALLNHLESSVKPARSTSISRKEQEIIALVSQGYRNREIAARLFISEQTVKAHISRIFRKFNISSRSQLVPLALQYRLPSQP